MVDFSPSSSPSSFLECIKIVEVSLSHLILSACLLTFDIGATFRVGTLMGSHAASHNP
jgi:hypothetical protein